MEIMGMPIKYPDGRAFAMWLGRQQQNIASIVNCEGCGAPKARGDDCEHCARESHIRKTGIPKVQK